MKAGGAALLVLPRGGSRALLLAGLVLLSACTTPVRNADSGDLQAQRAREARLATVAHWGLVGRIAVDDGTENGSGRIEWRQSAEHFEIVLAAPVSRRSWRLSGGPGGALLEGMDGGPRRGESAEQLLQTEAGWSVPLALLRAWARGMRGDPAARLGFGPQQPGQAALPSLLEEDGWSVQYRDWFTAQDPPMPRRVFARSGERQVRLVVERWLTPEQAMLPAGIRSPDSGR